MCNIAYKIGSLINKIPKSYTASEVTIKIDCFKRKILNF